MTFHGRAIYADVRVTPTAGDPNFIGDFGDDVRGSWGPSAFQRRNVFVANVLWDLPAGFFASLLYRGQEGNPFTPFVRSDLNADGEDRNDRPFLPDPANPTNIRFESQGDLDKYRTLIAENDCLADQIGRIAGRNICRNPWWHLLNLRIEWSIPTVKTQQLRLIVDIFNLLDAFDSRDENGRKTGPGRFVFKNSELFRAEGYDPDTNEVIYSVNSRFGEETPSGFEPFQFSAQIGVRYSF